MFPFSYNGKVAIYHCVTANILTNLFIEMFLELSSNNRMHFVKVIAIATEQPTFLVSHCCIFRRALCSMDLWFYVCCNVSYTSNKT